MRGARFALCAALLLAAGFASAQTSPAPVQDVALHDLLLGSALVIVYGLGFLGGNQGGGAA